MEPNNEGNRQRAGLGNAVAPSSWSLVLLLLSLLTGRTATAEPVYRYEPPLLVDHTNRGDVWVCYTRPKKLHRIIWEGHEYMVVDSAVDVEIWDPETGQLLSSARLRVGSGCTTTYGNDGVEGVAVCDECSFAFANTQRGLAVLAIQETSPSFPKPSLSRLGDFVPATYTGGTYKIGGVQYVLLGATYSSPYYRDCTPDGTIGVYAIDDAGGITGPIACMEDSELFRPKMGRQFQVLSGGGVHDFFVYRQIVNHDTYIVKLGSDGLPILPPENPVPFEGSNFDYYSLDTFDLADDSRPPPGPRGYLLITNAATPPHATVYEIRPDGSDCLLFTPVWENTEDIPWDVGAVHYPYVFLNMMGNPLQPRRLVDIATSPATYVDFDYWNDPEGDEDYNTVGIEPGKAIDMDALFTSDGRWLYFARFYQMSRFRYTCPPPSPDAHVDAGPDGSTGPAPDGTLPSPDGSADGGDASTDGDGAPGEGCGCAAGSCAPLPAALVSLPILLALRRRKQR